MGRWLPSILAFCVAGCLFGFVPQTNTRKRPKPSPVTKVTAATRAASSAKVEQYLADSAGTALLQAGALVPVFEQLTRLSAGEDPKSLHIMHFGDSHTAADEWTGGLRDLFKSKFGDGGSGFSVAGRPFPGYRRFDARGGATALWQSYGGRAGTGDGFFGLGGVSIFASLPGQS